MDIPPVRPEVLEFLGASYLWDDAWAVIGEQRRGCIAVQFHPFKRRGAGKRVAAPIAGRERALERE
jgi:hypothetical protein